MNIPAYHYGPNSTAQIKWTLHSIIKLLAVFTIMATVVGNSFADSNMAILNSPTARIEYSLGYYIASSEELKSIKIDPNALLQGIRDTLADQMQLSEAEMREVMLNLGREIVAHNNSSTEKMKAYRALNLEFLKSNQENPAVKVTESGLQYQVLKQGDGVSPKRSSLVKINYQARLIDGNQFESSYQKGKPVRIAVDEVIEGWSEALQLMKTGAEWRLFIPPDLAYGKQGIEHIIPPDSILIMEVELLAVE